METGMLCFFWIILSLLATAFVGIVTDSVSAMTIFLLLIGCIAFTMVSSMPG